ncbi:MAG: helix-hairpin-helix domain-containing protein [Deltaproteobacteria bacterium]|nr:helix-hairpin-helix domain-containing protein [Deltaproteobacteria bacterium]
MPEKHININAAQLNELLQIRGLGQDAAQHIIDFRKNHGDFKKWEELKDIPGFSETIIENLKAEGATLNGGGTEKRRESKQDVRSGKEYVGQTKGRGKGRIKE